MKKQAIAIDMGGTNLRFALVDDKGRINHLSKKANPGNKKKLLEAIDQEISRLLRNISKDAILGIGVSVASPNVNCKTGSINWNKETFPYFGSFNLKKYLEKSFNQKVFIENDLNAAALGELHFGALKGRGNGILITNSSGIGAGIVIDKELYRGNSFSAGEVGHMMLDLAGKNVCTRGDKGCWESFCSGRALEADYFRQLKEEKTAKEIVSLAKNGDKKSLKLLKPLGSYIGMGLSNIINILDPEVIIIYGSFFLEIWPLVRKDVKEFLLDRSFNPNVTIVKTELGDNGSLLGAACLALK